MIKKTSSKILKSPKRPSPSSSLQEIARRKEWRFDLPLTALVEGELPQGKKFQESAKLNNISSTGAYFKLNSSIVVGSKLTLVIDLPKEVTDGKKIQLRIEGITVRLEQPRRASRKKGVAVHFKKNFEFLASSKRP
jgi:hypothetical protein